MFGELIVAYLFLGGTGAGFLSLLCLGELAGRLRGVRAGVDPRAPSVISGSFSAPSVPGPSYRVDGRAWVVCLLFLLVGAACLLLDLGRPERALRILLSPHLSVVTVGSYALGLAIACAGVFAARAVRGPSPSRMTAAVWLGLSGAGIAIGLVTLAYTGFLLGDMMLVPFWEGPFMPVLFSLSSLSCGFALCVLTGCPFAGAGAMRAATRVDVAAIAAELVCLALFLGFSWVDPESRDAVEALVAGSLSAVFWPLLVAVGLVGPMALELAGLLRGWRRHARPAAAGILVGGIALRWCIVCASSFGILRMVDSIGGLTTAAL